MSGPDLGSSFNITDTTPRTSVTVQDITYASSATRDTSTCTGTGPFTCTDDPNGYLAAWKALILDSKLANAKAGLIFTPRAATDGTKPWSTATFVKIRAYIQWDEAQNRRRIAFFDTTKVNRQ